MIRERRAVKVLAVFLVLIFALQSCSTEMRDVLGSGVEEPLEESVGVSPATTVSSVTHMGLAGREVLDESSSVSSTSAVARSESGYTPAAMERRPVAYLEEVVPPCIPVVASELDPCYQVVPAVVESVSTPGGIRRWSAEGVPTFDGVLLGRAVPGTGVYPANIPHIAIRGAVQNGTTRCELYPYNRLSYRNPLFTKGLRYYYCFADISVREYIVGEGPDELTVIMHREVVWISREQFADWLNIRDKYVVDVLEDPQSRTSAVYEGKEMVLLLDVPLTVAVESWSRKGSWGTVWFLQRNEEGEIRALEQDVELAQIYEQIDPDFLLSEFDLPLSELVERIKEAAENRAVVTEGRIGLDSALPLLVTDANRLQDFYGAVGAVYEGDDATVLPPPVPGGDEPERDPTQTDVEEPVPVPPVPGEEETAPPPVDDAVTTSTGTTIQPQAGDAATSSTAVTITTAQPQAEEAAPPTVGTTLPEAGSDATVPAVDTGTTRPQAEGAASSTTSTTEPSDDEDAALPEEGDELPTPTGTTRPSDDGGGAGPAVGDDAGVGTGQ